MVRVSWIAVVSLTWGASACKQVELDEGNDVDCTGATQFVAGMQELTENGSEVRLVQARPAPPDVDDNEWVLEVVQHDERVDDLTVTVRPWMPLHGHGLVPDTYAGTSVGQGRYQIEVFDIIMPGLWEFHVSLASPDTGEEVETATFALCAEG